MRGTRFVVAIAALMVGSMASVAAAQAPKPATKMTEDLAALHDQFVAASTARVPLDTAESMLPVADDLVTIDATAADDPNVLAAHLQALGARDVAVAGWRVSARVPIPALPSLETLTSLRFAWPAYSATNVGAVTSQGDVAMRANIARNRFGLDGTGVKIGVLSDSFGCIAGGVATGMANGDLPAVTVLQEDAPCTNGTDEGRAMLEIVHDVAPGASLAFATANLGMASFAGNIRALRDAGAKVIVDDVFYFAEPMFQDGIIAQAVNDVAASGVAYFSSAGNQARQAFDTAFVPGTVYTAADPRLGGSATFLGGTAHNFGSTPFQTFTLGGGTSFTMVLQWDSPFFSVSGPPGAQTDVDVYVLNAAGTQVLFGATSNNIASGDPVEILRVSCGGPGSCSAAFLFVKHTGPNPGRFKYVLLQASSVTTNPGLNSGTIYGHANALGAVAVGAARYSQTPAFGVSPAVLEPFSSVGTTPILFGLSGNRLATPDLRASKPEIVAPDGADTSFFGSDSDGTGFPNFFGTSAAAPHAAAVGALMLQAVPTLTPVQIRTALQNTALDMAAPGFDNDTGSGFIQADAALAAAGAKVATTTTLTSSANPAVAGQSVTFTAHVGATVPGQVIPAGVMVSFFDGATNLGTAVLDLSGSGSFTTSALTVGLHTITAQYGGDVNNGASTGSFAQTIAKASTTTVVTASANPTIFGQAVTFTATVSIVSPGTGTPTGPVTFFDVLTAAPLGAAPLNAAGQATLTTGALTVGTHQIIGVYAGDANVNPSGSAPLTQTIVPAPSSTAVTASPNPTTFGRTVTFTATVTIPGPGSGTPTGVVTFVVDGVSLGVSSLNATGQATLSTSALAAGAHTILASYGGDANVIPSTSSALTLTVAKAATTTTLTSSSNTIVTGQPLTLTATVGLVAPSAGIPTGPVTFRDGTSVLGMASLTPTGGVATASFTTGLTTGAHSFTASFSGDANTNASTSAARMQTVTKAATSMTLTTSANTAVFGQSVTFTATRTVVAPGAGTPTGGVMFFNGATALGPAVTPDAAGVATLTTSVLTLGPHAITARYVGDASFTTSTSSPLTVTIVKASTATTVTASANPAAWHQAVTLTAAVSVVAPGAGTPTGMVTFFNGPTALGTGVLNAMGRAALTTSTLTVGDHAITASYAGAASFNGSVSTVFTETVVPAPSATTLTASPNPAVTGRLVMLTATVAVVAPSAGTPTGAVTFFDGPAPLSTVPLTAGHATLTVNALAVGAHALTAGYGGDGNVAPSTSTAATETINRAATTTTLTSSANPSVTGRAVTFTAKVSVVAPGIGTPTGVVTFMDGATPLGVAPLDATRQATLTTSALPVGSHPITAVYGGDAGFATSTSLVVAETIGKAATKTTLTSSATPAVHGVPVTFTATVTVVAPGAGTPTGPVTFLDGVTVLGTAMLNATGQASLTTGALVAGARSITARYAGDGSFATSTSAALSETVTKASTLTLLATSTSAAVVGQPVVLTATVSVVAPGAGTPTGSVMFFNGAAPLGTAPLTAAGVATLTTSTLSLGAHPSITARYAGDASFTTSTSSAVSVTIARASTATSVSASANPAALHQPVTLTAAVTVVAPGAGAPMGTVTFFNGPTSVGTGTLSAMGRATLTTSALTLGDHDVTASYGGAANFNGSVSTVFTETVTRAASATALTATPNPSVAGRPVVFTATVSVVAPGAGTPTGTVTFLDGATPLDTRPLNPARQATLTTNGLTVGAHAITATYNGDTGVAPSTSTVLTETINLGGTTTALTSSANPAAVGQMVTLTATVNPVAPAAGVPTGNVTFMEGTTALGTATLNATRQATLSTGALAFGSHALTAIYAGDASFASSTSMLLTERITNLAPAITSPNTVTFTPGLAGQTFTVATTGIPTNTITRTGTLPSGVTFTDNHDNTATIAGTPAAGTQSNSPYAWVLTAANGTPPNATQSFTFRLACPTITVSGTIPALTFNAPMPAAAFTQAGGTGTITWSASGLPAGTAINAASGQVTGTPTATGTFSATITATDAGGCPGSAQQSVTVAPVVAGLTFSGLVDNTQFVITGGTTASPTTPFVQGTGRLGSNGLPSGGVSATAGTFPTTAGGSVTIASDGSFIYTPKANPGAAATTSDSFTYTVVSNTGGGAAVPSAPAPATLTLAGRVWYVKNNAAAGNGQSQAPFNTLAAAVAASTPSDRIFVYQGSGTSANLTTPAILKTGQQLIGEGAGLAVNGQSLVAAGGFPLLGGALTLAGGVTVAGIDLSTGAAGGLTGTGVAGVSVTMRDLTTTTGTAVNIGGPSNSGTFSFRKISASGGANGIVLQNVTGSFTVTGDGANTSVGGNASGGTISNMTGADSSSQATPFAGVGIYLNNVQNVTLRRMTINGTNQNYGIRGFAVNGFTLEYSTVSGTNGTAAILAAPEEAGEGSIYFGNSTTTGLSTSAVFTGNVIQGGRARNLSIMNAAPGLTTLMIKGNTFGLNQNFADADQSLAVEAIGSGTRISAIVGGPSGSDANVFTGAPGDLVNFTGQTDTDVDVVFQQNALSNSHPQNIVGGGGMTLATQGAMTFDVSGNAFSGADGSALTLFKANGGALLNGVVNNNTIGVSGVADSGSKSGNGILVSAEATGTLGLTITNNTIMQYSTAGIYADNTGGSYTANFTITGNTTSQPSPEAFAGLVLTNGSPGSNDTINVCAKITGNDFSAGDPASTSDALLVASGAGGGPSHTFNLPGYAGSTLADVVAFLGANNPPPAATVFAVRTDAPVTAAAFTGLGTSCPTP